MNRAQRRARQQGKAKPFNFNDPAQAQHLLENMPIATLVAGINNSINVLTERGIPVADWDEKDRELYGLKVFSGKVYFLAAEPEQNDM